MIINKRFYAYASSEISIIVPGAAAIEVVTEIHTIDYSDAMESEGVPGTGRDPLGRTDPVYVPGDCNWAMYKKRSNALVASLAAAALALGYTSQANAGAGQVPIVIKLKYRTTLDEPITEDEIQIAHTGALKDSAAVGSAPISTAWTGPTTGILRNGVRL